jgi:hypothetical protein
LKWLPYRPTIVRDEKVVPAEHVVKSVSMVGSRVARRTGSDPFNDPFGDRGGPDMAQRPAVNDDVLEKPAVPQAIPTASPPQSLPPLDDRLEVKPGPAAPPTKLPAEPDLGTIKEGTFNESFARGKVDLTDKCPSPKDLKPINELTVDIKAEDGFFPKECSLGEETYQPRAWACTTYTWKASGLCHNPLYFADVQLERYGHSWGPFLQPVISGGHFFLNVPILPYKMGINPPGECVYTLGYYRPGNCAPYMLDPIPLSVRGALYEAGVWVGGVLLIP